MVCYNKIGTEGKNIGKRYRRNDSAVAQVLR